jgi:hypothetical protein
MDIRGLITMVKIVRVSKRSSQTKHVVYVYCFLLFFGTT